MSKFISITIYSSLLSPTLYIGCENTRSYDQVYSNKAKYEINLIESLSRKIAKLLRRLNDCSHFGFRLNSFDSKDILLCKVQN